MKYIYIKLSDNLENALYQLISANIIAEYQEGILVIEESCKYKNDIFQKYHFKNIVCRNMYNEKNSGDYNCFKIKFYKYNLELVGEFKNINLFINHVDGFIKTLVTDNYKTEIDSWLKQIDNYKLLTYRSDNIIKLNLFSNKYVNSVEHRGGWKNIITYLFDSELLSLNDTNYYLIDMIENYINDKNLIIKKKWFGFIHSTSYVPNFLNIPTVTNIVQSIFLKNNKKSCLGLITFSSNIKEILDNSNLNINILYVKHPIDHTDIKLCDIDNFINNPNKQIVLLGKQLRKSSSIYLLDTIYTKVWLPGTKKYIESSINNLKKELVYLNKHINDINFNSVNIKYFESHTEYDNFILDNIIIIDLWDTNANNSIIECLIRNIPFFVSKLIGTIEYLGADYPMYFESIIELENILNNQDINILYKKTYNYLKYIDKSDLDLKHFNFELGNFIMSNVNKIEMIYSNIKEHNNWSYIEKYLFDKLNKICFLEKIIFIPFVDIFILDNTTISTDNNINNSKNLNWIGIIHNPILKNIYPENDIFVKKKFLNYLNYCKGLFVMSNELKEFIIKEFNPSFFVEVIHHPLPNIEVNKWNYDSYIQNENKKIIQVGNWLRKTYGIFKINVQQSFTKAITPFGERTQNELKFWSNKDKITISESEYNSVIKFAFIEDKKYIELFKNNLFFLDLYDSTANNIILECIKANCPIIVNNNSSVKNYLGDTYPLYYKNYDNINDLLTNENILKAHKYLENLDKGNLTNEYMFQNIFNVLKINKIIK